MNKKTIIFVGLFLSFIFLANLVCASKSVRNDWKASYERYRTQKVQPKQQIQKVAVKPGFMLKPNLLKK